MSKTTGALQEEGRAEVEEGAMSTVKQSRSCFQIAMLREGNKPRDGAERD